jgi:hypothetical protein
MKFECEKWELFGDAILNWRSISPPSKGKGKDGAPSYPIPTAFLRQARRAAQTAADRSADLPDRLFGGSGVQPCL